MTNQLIVLNNEGDVRVTWSPIKPTEVEAAHKMYDDLRAKGYAAFSVKESGAKNELITEFDPGLEKIIMTPRIVGG